jgi:hypothetical protein
VGMLLGEKPILQLDLARLNNCPWLKVYDMQTGLNYWITVSLQRICGIIRLQAACSASFSPINLEVSESLYLVAWVSTSSFVSRNLGVRYVGSWILIERTMPSLG